EIARRGEFRGRLDQTREERRFRERHVARGLAEVALRRRLDAVSAGAEIDAVEIEVEDLVLGIFPLEPYREDHLLQLALHGALLRQEQVLGELLRDGRAALRYATMQHVRADRARN